MGLRVLTPCDVLICRWCDKNELLLFGVTSEKALRAYFLAAANIFEPDRTVEGLMWTRTSLVTEAISWHLQRNGCTKSKMESLIHKLENHRHYEPTRSGSV
jgi:hypothetical protein